MWNKSTITTLFFSLIFISQTSTSSAFYQDVEPDHLNYEAINVLYSLEKLPNDTHFYPNETLTKAELYKILITFTQIPLTEEINLDFTDIEENSDYNKYIQTAVDHNFLQIHSNWFGAKKNVTTQKAIEQIFSALGVGTTTLFNTADFPIQNLEPNSPLAPIALKSYQLGLLQDNTFNPLAQLSKGEFAEMLYRIDEQQSYSPYTYQDHTPNKSSNLESNDTYYVLEDVYDSLQYEYYYQEETDDSELIYGAIEGMISKLDDPYTSFQEPTEAGQFLDSLTGEFEGIGIVIEVIDNNITIITPLKNSPAEEAGLKANDVITAVDNEDVDPNDLNNVANRIRGAAGTTVEIQVTRSGKSKSFTVKRGFIMIKSVNHEVVRVNGKNIANIQIVNFGDNTYKELLETLEELEEEAIQGYILDVRNNPGGYVDVAVSIIGLLSDESETAVEISHNSGSKESYFTNGKGSLTGKPLAILVNEGSASASEILAGFIQDNEIGIVIGENTFGKGSVQRLTEYMDGSLFKYTIAKWITPKGQDISEAGITPDIIVEQNSDSETDYQLQKALEQF
jgi:C-terminal peptidase prc